MMKVIAIAAVSKNGVIGKENGLPWEIPEDMKFFRDSTREQIVLMGRKTFDALGKPLPKRENAVITRDHSWKHEGVRVFHSAEEAVSYYKVAAKTETAFAGKNLFVIGGAEIYRLMISFYDTKNPLLDEVWLTEIEEEVAGDAYFPFYKDGKFLRPEFKVLKTEPQKDFGSSPYRYSFNYYGLA